MRKSSFLLLALVALLFPLGARAEAPCYDKYLISPVIQARYAPDPALYRRLFDALDAMEQRADVSDLRPSAAQVADVTAALFDRFEFSMLRAISYDADNFSVALDIRPSGDAGKRQVQAFRDRVQALMQRVACAQSQTEQALLLHQYFASTTEYDAEAPDVGPWGVMVDSRGICTGYAYAMAYVLDQLGIENHLTHTDDGVHIFNTARLDGQYYHLDATYESTADAGGALVHFGMTDARAHAAYGSYTSGNPNSATYETPACTSARFAWLGDAAAAQFCPENGTIYYSDMARDGSLYARALRTGKDVQVLQDEVIALRYFDGALYMQFAKDPMAIFRMTPGAPDIEKVDTPLASVTRMRVGRDGLILHDDTTGGQATLPPLTRND
ncbi:MAG: hypothetical protein RR843_01405 [Clostridia bacterium]